MEGLQIDCENNPLEFTLLCHWARPKQDDEHGVPLVLSSVDISQKKQFLEAEKVLIMVVGCAPMAASV